MEYKHIEWSDEKVKKFWDFESQFPKKYFTYSFGSLILDELNESLKGKRTVLDYGTGIGLLIPHLLRQNFEVTGTDFSIDSISLVNEKFKAEMNFKGAFYIDDIMNVDKKYDVIFCIEMIEHINDHYLTITFENFKNLLSDDGIIVVTTPNSEVLEENMVFCPNCDSVFHRWQHVKSWSPESLEKTILKYGLNVDKIYTTSFRPPIVEEKTYSSLIAGIIRKYLLGRKVNERITHTHEEAHLVAIIKK